jgi:hypothetical protein
MAKILVVRQIIKSCPGQMEGPVPLGKDENMAKFMVGSSKNAVGGPAPKLYQRHKKAKRNMYFLSGFGPDGRH